jgi:ribosomal protein S18 acetylase RimI-like enzyme
MYVAPEERRRGVGRALLDEVVSRVRATAGVEQIELAVVHEVPARGLYLAAGFTGQGTLRAAMKDGLRYHDEDLMILRLSDGG